MNTATRLNKIEQKIVKKNGQKKFITVEEFEGKYYMKNDGQTIEVEQPTNDDPDKMIVILKSYSKL